MLFAQKLKVKHYPLSKAARYLIAIGFVLNLLAVSAIIYFYPKFAHLSSTAIWLVPTLFSGVFILLLLILRYRYTILEKYPYLLNLPSFVYRLGMENNPKLEGKVINKVFTVYTISLLYISILNAIITITFVTQDTSFLIPSIITLVILLLVSVFWFYRSIYRSFAIKEG